MTRWFLMRSWELGSSKRRRPSASRLDVVIATKILFDVGFGSTFNKQRNGLRSGVSHFGAHFDH